MKKIFLKRTRQSGNFWNSFHISVAAALIMFAPQLTNAAGVALSPSSVSVGRGQNFSATITIDPQENTVYTSKIEVTYPADLVTINSFNLNGWIAVQQSGYDVIDNENGVLIKTAGFPGGNSSPFVFGTISFSAENQGSGSIQIGGDTLVLDAQGENTYTGGTVVSVEVTTQAVAAPPTPSIPQSSAEEVSPPEIFDLEIDLGESEESTPQPSLQEEPKSKALFDVEIEPSTGEVKDEGTSSLALVLLSLIPFIALALIAFLLYTVFRK